MPSKEALVEAAELRARIVSTLTSSPGTEFRSGEIATALDRPRTKVADQLQNLADSGQIQVRHQGRIGYYSLPGTGEAPRGEAVEPPRVRRPEAQRSKVTATNGEEVELVLSGITIIAGRNPKTGRIRIELA